MFHTIQKFLNNKQQMISAVDNSKEQFLLKHNQLSPANMQATAPLLSRFRTEKSSLFKDKDWPLEKIRRPFIMWLTSLTAKDKENINKNRI